ncbi:MAG TPA: AMP-binding protein [Candidatus Sulfopaludibacter sp.]|nr:AMP-binding protein [Candidatus Sulfopaludibacter sp.]
MKNSNQFQTHVISPLLTTINQFHERKAFCINEVFYTYKQLGELISNIRFAIRELNEDYIYFGLIANDDLETYASILALWLEGKAYVPLHPNQPLDRWKEIIKQTGIKTILSSGDNYESLNCKIVKTYNLAYKADLLEYDFSIDDGTDCYVLFTSGSTGTPKGVRINRTNISAFMDSFWNCGINITEEDKCLQCFDLTFDVSVQSFLAPLIKGACVYTIPHDQIKYSYVAGLLEDENITFGAIAPSMLRYLKPYFDEIHCPGLKCCILTGEASPLDLVKQWEKCVPNAEIFDFYGPTETTIYCTYYKLNKGREIKTLNGMLSIGVPMKNVEAIVVDEEYNILSTGEKGELCISGDQVSAGYWNNPEKNAASFFEKEYNGKIQRFYHTGDLCYFDNDKHLMLYGRLDSQTKIQGYRVELGEIEFHAREFLKGANAIVVTFDNSIGNTELVLFAEGETVNTISLMDYLKTKLPFYMIPSKIIQEQQFPLNSNSKVDKIKLKKRISEI